MTARIVAGLVVGVVFLLAPPCVPDEGASANTEVLVRQLVSRSPEEATQALLALTADGHAFLANYGILIDAACEATGDLDREALWIALCERSQGTRDWWYGGTDRTGSILAWIAECIWQLGPGPDRSQTLSRYVAFVERALQTGQPPLDVRDALEMAFHAGFHWYVIPTDTPDVVINLFKSHAPRCEGDSREHIHEVLGMIAYLCRGRRDELVKVRDGLIPEKRGLLLVADIPASIPMTEKDYFDLLRMDEENLANVLRQHPSIRDVDPCWMIARAVLARRALTGDERGERVLIGLMKEGIRTRDVLQSLVPGPLALDADADRKKLLDEVVQWCHCEVTSDTPKEDIWTYLGPLSGYLPDRKNRLSKMPVYGQEQVLDVFVDALINAPEQKDRARIGNFVGDLAEIRFDVALCEELAERAEARLQQISDGTLSTRATAEEATTLLQHVIDAAHRSASKQREEQEKQTETTTTPDGK